MHLRHVALAVASGLVVLGALFLATADVRVLERDCGSPLLVRDNSKLAIQTGNVADDDFAVQRILDSCSHAIAARRIIVGLMAVLSVALGVAASRSRPRPQRFPGDPIV